MNKDLIVEYADLKIEAKRIEDRIDEIKKDVLENLEVAGLNKDHPVELKGYGTFVLSGKRVWKYSQETQDLEKKLKEQMIMEEQTGMATSTENSFIKFTQEK